VEEEEPVGVESVIADSRRTGCCRPGGALDDSEVNYSEAQHVNYVMSGVND